MSREVKARRPYVSNVTSWNLRTGLRDVRQNGDAVVRRLEQLARTVQLADNTCLGAIDTCELSDQPHQARLS